MLLMIIKVVINNSIIALCVLFSRNTIVPWRVDGFATIQNDDSGFPSFPTANAMLADETSWCDFTSIQHDGVAV